MEPDRRAVKKPRPGGQSPEARRAACARCGRQFRSSTERLRVADGSFICSQCYKHLTFPDHVVRCME